ncbi:hypothetical protein I4U23_017162 [Adineta vaga]|nr:hypothetical protein I4U23_017162 [Adineta vaga]
MMSDLQTNIDKETCSFRKIDIRKSRSFLEDLSNEVLMEIFDYLNGFDVFDAFSTLNDRFHHLICSCMLLKIRLSSSYSSTVRNRSWRVIFPHRHRVISLCLPDRLSYQSISRFGTIDSSFTYLQCLTLNNIPSKNLESLLINLISVPRLISLKMTLQNDINDHFNLYQFVFRLPFLKYVHVTCHRSEIRFSFSIPPNEQFTRLEHLILNHRCSVSELFTLFSSTPFLRRVTCEHLYGPSSTSTKLILSNLRSMSFGHCHLDFDGFETFMTCLSANLQCLRVTTTENSTYLDAHRWEQFFSKFFPSLHQFYFRSEEKIRHRFMLRSHYHHLHQFTSHFWIERQWLLEILIDATSEFSASIVFQIEPWKAKKRWHQVYEHIRQEKFSQTCSTQWLSDIPYATNIHLILNQRTNQAFEKPQDNHLLIYKFESIFSLVPVTHLEVTFRRMFLQTLLRLLGQLPNLHSLKLSCQLLLQMDCLSDQDKEMIQLVKMNNRISSISLMELTEFQQIQFLLDLFPYLEYLQIDLTKQIDFEHFLQAILKRNPQDPSRFSALCLYVNQDNDQVIEQLRTIIDQHRLLNTYLLQRLDKDNLYLRWN